MKERPILFSGEMVRAILDGSKTMTRRVIKHRHEFEIREDENGVPWPYFPSYVYAEPEPMKLVCPYGQPGDRLWVRETWASMNSVDHLSPKDIERLCREAGYETGPCGDLWYKADNSYRQWGDDRQTKGKWRPSRFMPRWASRISREITNVRVERLQEITEEDAKNEGANPMHIDDLGQTWSSYKRGFQSLWDSINLKRGYGWDANPRVWVVTFKRLL